jgi:hypothetical protein
MVVRPWQFMEVSGGSWCWQRSDTDQTSTQMGPFPDLARCILHAEEHGFDETKLERKRPRVQMSHESRCVGGS